MDIFTAVTFDTWTVLAQTLIFGIALTAAVAFILAFVAPVNASTRFAVWFAALIAIAVLPPAFLLRSSIPQLAQQNVEQKMTPADVPPAISSAVRPVEREYVPPVFIVPGDFAQAFPALYAVVIAVLFGRLAVSYGRLQRLKRTTSPAPEEVKKRFESWLSLCEIRRPVQLLLSTKARSPMAVGFTTPAVMIPDSLLLRLTGDQLDYLGLHELAHLRRYDDWTNLIQRAIQALFFFHPAVHWICRRLDFEREVACDDWVLSLTGAAKPYARSLAKILECTPWRRGPVLASGAVFRKRQILRRIEMLLDGSRDSKPKVSQVTFVVILMCLFGAFIQMAQMPALIAFGDDDDRSRHRSRWKLDGRTVETEIRGEIQFGDDDISVKTLSPGGYLRLKENGWTPQELEVRPGESGELEVRYRVDGRERPLDDKARAWVATILPDLIRETGIGAEERALRILRKRGPSGLFEEIDRISSDHSRLKYLSAVIRSGNLNTDDLRRAMTRAGRISSDQDKANLLLEVAATYSSDQLRSAYFDALNTIGSDHDRRRVLSQLLEGSGTDAAVLARAGRAVEQMSSDHDKSQLLQLSAQRIATTDREARRSLMRAIASIGSDHDKAAALSSMLGATQLEPEALEDVLRVAAKIGSDHDKAQVLAVAAQQNLNEPSVYEEFFAAVATINSDHDKAELLSALAESYRTNPEIRNGVQRAAERISSDSDYRRVVSKLLAEARQSTPQHRE